MKPGNLIFVGAIAGLVIGLIITWAVAPIEYYNTWPPMMDQQHQEDWITLTAMAYAVEGNWDRTEIRLQGIEPVLIESVLTTLIENSLNKAYPLDVLQRLAQLGERYNVDSPAVSMLLQQSTIVPPTAQTAATPTATVTMAPTDTPVPPTNTPVPTLTSTPSPTPEAITAAWKPFTIVSQTLKCADVPSIAITLELSQTVTVRRKEVVEQVPQPGREIWLIWESGADRAITGFKPEYGLGYADFDIVPGWTYNIYIDQPTGVPLLSIQAEPCIVTEASTGRWTTRHLIVYEELPPDTPTPTPTAKPED